MYAGGELLNTPGADTKAKLKLGRKQELGTQGEEQRIFERVRNCLELIAHRRIGSFEEGQPLRRPLEGCFKDSLSLCTIGQRTRAHDVSNDSVSQSHSPTLFLVSEPQQAPLRRGPIDSSASHDTSRQTYFNQDVNIIESFHKLVTSPTCPI